MIYTRKGRGRKSWKKLSASGHKINFANVLRQGDMTTLQSNGDVLRQIKAKSPVARL